MEVGIALQHHAPVGIVLAQHIGAGADRIPVERDVALGQSRLGIEDIGLPGHGREEGHGEPVLELRILAFETDAQRLAVQHLDAAEARLTQGRDPLQRAGRLQTRKLVGQFTEAANVLAHQSGDRRMRPGRGQTLDLMGEVLGGQLARAGCLEVGQTVDALEIP